MAQGNPVGTMYVELSLDATKYTAGQKRILAEAQKNSADINRVFSILGTKTDEMFNATRLQAQNAYNAIAKSARSSTDEIRRAHEGLAKRLKQIDEEQFGKRTAMLDTFRKNWIATAAVIAAAVGTGVKIFGMAKAGAAFDEQLGMLDNLARKYKTTADTIITEMDRASKEQIAKSELMSIALAGIAKGLTPEQLINLANAAETLGDAVGKTATEALRDLTEALETGRTRGLKNYLGAALDLEKSFGDLASKMTDAEKAQAMYNLTMIAAIDIQSQQTKAVDEGADSLARIEKKYDDAMLAASRYFKTLVVGAIELGKQFKDEWFVTSLLFNKNPLSKQATSNQNISDYAAGPGWTSGQAAAAIAKSRHEEEIERLKKLIQAREDLKKVDKSGEKEAEQWLSTYLKGVDAAWKREVERNEGIGELVMIEMKWADEKFEKEKKLAEELAKKQVEEQKKALEKMQKEWEHFWERVQDATADVLYDIFNGTVKTWDDVLDRMKQLFWKWVSEIAAQQIILNVKGLFGGSGAGGGGFLSSIGSMLGVSTGAGGGGTSGLLSLGSMLSSGYGMVSGNNALSLAGIGGAAGAWGSGSMGAITAGASGYVPAGASAASIGAGASIGWAALPLMIPTIGKLLGKIGPGPKTHYDQYLTAPYTEYLGGQMGWTPGKGMSNISRYTGPSIMGGNKALDWVPQSIQAYTDAANQISAQFSQKMLALIKLLPSELGKQLESRLQEIKWGVGTWDEWFRAGSIEEQINKSVQILIDAYNEIFETLTDKGTKNVMEIVTKYNNAMVLKALYTPQWEQFVMGLKTSDLAPVQSMETFSYYYKSLQDKVRANPSDQEAVNQLLQYTSGTYLPFAKSYMEGGGDYASIFNQIVGGTGDLYNTVFGDIKSVTDQFNELIDYLKGVVDRPIKISINLNGNQIAQAVAVAVDQGNVVIPTVQPWEGGGGTPGNTWDASGGGP